MDQDSQVGTPVDFNGNGQMQIATQPSGLAAFFANNKTLVIIIGAVLATLTIIIIGAVFLLNRNPSAEEVFPRLQSLSDESFGFFDSYYAITGDNLMNISSEQELQTVESSFNTLKSNLNYLLDLNGIAGVDGDIFQSSRDNIRGRIGTYGSNLALIRNLSMSYIIPINSIITRADRRIEPSLDAVGALASSTAPNILQATQLLKSAHGSLAEIFTQLTALGCFEDSSAPGCEANTPLYDSFNVAVSQLDEAAEILRPVLELEAPTIPDSINAIIGAMP